MAFSGQVLHNPISGEQITFRKTAADTDGDLLALDLELFPDGHVPAPTCTLFRRSASKLSKGQSSF